MPERKPLLLRLDPVTLAALRGWAADDLRSLNGQVEFVLRRALREAGRLPAPRPLDGALPEVEPATAPGLARPSRATRDRASVIAEKR